MLLFVVSLYVAVCCCLFICCCLLLYLYVAVCYCLFICCCLLLSLYMLLFVIVSLYVAVCCCIYMLLSVIYIPPKSQMTKCLSALVFFLCLSPDRPAGFFPLTRLCYRSVIILRVCKSTTFSPYLQIFAAILDFFNTFVLLFPVFLNVFLFLSHPSFLHPSFLHSPVSFSSSLPSPCLLLSRLLVSFSPSLHLPRVVITSSRQPVSTKK